MARVQVATEAWGYIVSTNGRPMAGQLCAIDTTVYEAATGGSTIAPAAFVSDAEGLLPGWVEPGRYTFTEPDSDTRTVIAGGGYQTVMDESSVMAKRDTLKFEGDAISLQDDSANDRTRVIVTGSPGAAGPPGEIFGVDVWNEDADPESVTDWGPTINTLISGGAKLLLFRAETFPYSTPIALNQKHHVVLEGETGLSWYGGPDFIANTSRLLWKGTGSGAAINCKSADGVLFRDLVLDWDQSGFTGDLIVTTNDGGATPPSSFVGFERCRLGIESRQEARSVLNLSGAVYPFVRECMITGGQAGILGYDTAGETIPGNDAVIENCQMGGSIVLIRNPGLNWRVKNLTLEFTNSNTTHGIKADLSASAGATPDFRFENFTFWDNAVGTQIAIEQAEGVSWNAKLERMNLIGTPVGMKLLGKGNIEIQGGGGGPVVQDSDDWCIDVGDGADSDQRKTSIIIEGYHVPSTSGGGTNGIKNLGTGHGYIRVVGGPNNDNHAGQQNVETSGGPTALWYYGPGHKPTVAKVAGQSNVSDESFIAGHDGWGFVVCLVSGGSSTAGDLLTVTFGDTLIRGSAVHGSASNFVIIPEIHPLGSDACNFGTLSGSESAKCAPYAKMLSGDKTKFIIGTGNAIPAGVRVGFAFRVAVP